MVRAVCLLYSEMLASLFLCAGFAHHSETCYIRVEAAVGPLWMGLA